jgi:ankyrin repeat protein
MSLLALSQWEVPEECAEVLKELAKIDEELEAEEAAANQEDDLLFDDEKEELSHNRKCRSLNEGEKPGDKFAGRETSQAVEFTGEDRSDPFHVPHELINEFAPQELDEVVEQFKEYDEDGSMGINGTELAKLFANIKMNLSPEELQEHFKVADVDGSGEIDFQEFLFVVVSARRGDGKLAAFNALAQSLNETPIAMLHKKCSQRDLVPTYELLEERAGTAMHGPCIVMQVSVYGEWNEMIDGVMHKEVKGKIYQGIGHTSRNAKCQAAMCALTEIQGMLPGLMVDQGVIPDDWRSWMFQNMEGGVSADECLTIMVAKAFTPAKNRGLMHQLIIRHFFKELQARTPDQVQSLDGRIPSGWMALCDQLLTNGFEGYQILGQLVDIGFDPESNPDLANRLHSHHASETGSKQPPLVSREEDFWSACAEGQLAVVRMYICGGQLADEAKCKPGLVEDPNPWSGLHLAARFNHVSVCEYLLEAGASADLPNLMGRTALHIAAMYRNPEAIDAILKYKPNPRISDRYGEQPIHAAARSGNAVIVNSLLIYEKRSVMGVLSNQTPCTRQRTRLKDGRVAIKPFAQVLAEVYDLMMEEKLDGFDMQYFQKHWLLEAAQKCYDTLKPELKFMLPKPEVHLVDYVKSRFVVAALVFRMNCNVLFADCRFDPDPKCGYWSGKRGEEKFHETIANSGDLVTLLTKVFTESYMNCKNERGNTPLLLACLENLVSTHEDAIRCLLDEFGCDTDMSNDYGQTAYQLLVDIRDRLGTPRGLALREEMIAEKRHILRDVAERKAKEEREWTERQLWSETLKKEMEVGMTCDTWELMRSEADKLRLLGDWEEFVDPDTSNRFYFNAKVLANERHLLQEKNDVLEEKKGVWKGHAKSARAAGRATKKMKEAKEKESRAVMEAAEVEEKAAADAVKYTKGYSWSTPPAVWQEEEARRGWDGLRNKSKLLKVEQGGWEKRMCGESNRVWYHDPVSGESSWEYPDQLCKLLGMPTSADRPKDPTGTKCKHKILWEKCKRCQKDWNNVEAAKIAPEYVHFEEEDWVSMIENKAAAQELRILNGWQEWVHLPTGCAFYTFPAEPDEDDETSDGAKHGNTALAVKSESMADEGDDSESKTVEDAKKYCWEKPPEVGQAERERFGWALVRRRAVLFTEEPNYEQYTDTKTNLMFWFFWEKGISHTEYSLPHKYRPKQYGDDSDDEEVGPKKPQYKSSAEVRIAREEEEWRKNLSDARRKEERRLEREKQAVRTMHSLIYQSASSYPHFIVFAVD